MTHPSSLGPQPVREKAACQNCLPQGLEPPAKPAPNDAKPCAKPSTKSAVKPAAKVAASPAASLQLESPFLWPLLSMCSSSESNTPAKKSGTQSQFLSRAEHASQLTGSGSFVVHMPSCLHVLFCVAHLLHSNWACGGIVIWGMFHGGHKCMLQALGFGTALAARVARCWQLS